MNAETLFSAHQKSALGVADDLSWRYSLTGTYAYLDDMRQFALMGLWEACTRFNPDKQQFHKMNMQKHLDDSFWSVVLSDEIPEQEKEKADPYATFWQWAYMRVYGSVMDYLRKEGLITKIQAKDKGKTTMLYKNRFLSGDAIAQGHLSVEGVDDPVSFLDLFPSKDTSDRDIQFEDRKNLLRDLISSSGLTDLERELVLNYYCTEEHVSMREIAKRTNTPGALVSPTLRSAIDKIRRSPVLLSYRSGKELTKYLLWWLFCVKKGDDTLSPVISTITVSTAGTAVQWTSDTTKGAGAIAIAPHPSNSGTNIYVGVKGLVGSTYTNLIANGILQIGSSFSISCPTGTSALLPSDYFFDVDTNGDKILVTYWPI